MGCRKGAINVVSNEVFDLLVAIRSVCEVCIDLVHRWPESEETGRYARACLKVIERMSGGVMGVLVKTEGGEK